MVVGRAWPTIVCVSQEKGDPAALVAAAAVCSRVPEAATISSIPGSSTKTKDERPEIARHGRAGRIAIHHRILLPRFLDVSASQPATTTEAPNLGHIPHPSISTCTCPGPDSSSTPTNQTSAGRSMLSFRGTSPGTHHSAGAGTGKIILRPR